MKNKNPPNNRIPVILAVCIAAMVMIIAAITAPNAKPYQKKANALKQEVQKSLKQSGFKPDGDYVVFISTSSGEYRANVYTGTGSDFTSAWNDASQQAAQASESSEYPVKYVKCDIVSTQTAITADGLAEYFADSMKNYCFYGIAFDRDFHTAFLESECNAAGIYNL